jgi:hypothetical protein
VTTSPRVRSEMSGSEEKIDGSDYHVRERYAAESWMYWIDVLIHIYRSALAQP